MKSGYHKLVLAAILCTAFVFVSSVGALAAVATGAGADSTLPTVKLSADSSTAVFQFNRDSDNLFDSFDGVMPGDQLAQKLRIEADGGNPASYRIYLYAQENAEAGNTENFLNSMELTVSDAAGKPLKVMHADAATQGVLLGTFAAGESTELDVMLTVPIAMGNDFQGAKSVVDWRFYAQQVADSGGGNPGGGGNPDDGGNSGGNPPGGGETVDITDPDVPKGDLDLPDLPEQENLEEDSVILDPEVPLGGLPEINIEEDTVPLGDIPKTSDDSNILLFVVLMIVSGTALTALLLTGKKPIEEKENRS